MRVAAGGHAPPAMSAVSEFELVPEPFAWHVVLVEDLLNLP